MTIDQTRPAPRRPGTLPAFTPVPRLCPRHDGWTPERQQNFIEALADTGSVKAAAHAVNMAPEGAYQLRRHAAAASFRKAWEAALALGVQRLEDVAMERALHGTQVPVYSYGKLIGTRTVHNDRLLMFLLRHRAPTRFTADGGKPKGPDAIGKMELTRLKRQWRKEWQREAAIADVADNDKVLAEIDHKLDSMRNNWLAAMTTRTRALYDAYRAAEAEDEAAGRTSYSEEMEAEDEDADWETRALPGPGGEPDWRGGE